MANKDILLRLLFGVVFSLTALFGLEFSINLSPVGLLMDGWQSLNNADTLSLCFALPAFPISFFLEKRVRHAKTIWIAFLWGASITALVATFGGLLFGLANEPNELGAAILYPFASLAFDVFLVSPFVIGGILSSIWWFLLNCHNKSLQSNAKAPTD